MTGVLPVDEFRTLVLANTTGTATAPASTAPAWPVNALTLDQARFEVVDWGRSVHRIGLSEDRTRKRRV